MQFWHRLKTLWRNVSSKQKIDEDLDDEIRSYREMLEDEKARTSADPGTARREALLELGEAEQIKEAVRDVRVGVTLDAIAAELRQSWRGLRRNPGLTILGTLMLALGMGASIAVFSIFYSALLRPLPFRDSDRLVQISETRLARGIDRASFTEANFWDVRSQNRSFAEVGTYHYDEANLTGDGPSERVTAGLSAQAFSARWECRPYSVASSPTRRAAMGRITWRSWATGFGGAASAGTQTSWAGRCG